jgi:hypothetical protein
MAKKGAALASEGPEPFLPLAYATCKQAAADGLEHKWNTKWHRHRPCRQTRIFFPNSNLITSRSLLFHPRQDLGLLSRHLLGHSYLNYHQSKQTFGLDPICLLCGKQKEESHHIICTCLALSQLRLQCLWQQTITDNVWNIPGLLILLSSPQVVRLEDPDAPTVSNTGPVPNPSQQSAQAQTADADSQPHPLQNEE